MFRTTRISLGTINVLSLIGLGISIYQSHHFFALRSGTAGFKNLCSFGSFDCTAVELSAYAQLLPGLPLSSLAAGGYLFLFILALLARNPFWKREAVRCIFLFTLAATAVSIAYFIVMAFVLKTFCLFCLIIDGINILCLVFALLLKPESLKEHPPEKQRWKTLAWIGIGAIAINFALALIMSHKRLPQGEIDREITRFLKSSPFPLTESERFPSIGPKDAPVTITKFSDFQCPACQRGAFSVHPLFNRFKGQIRFVFRNFPLDPSCNRLVQQNMHPAACEAAKVALCTYDIGGPEQFEAFYQQTFERQTELASGFSKKLAIELGVDLSKLEACVSDPATQYRIDRDIDEGEKLKVQFTPTFFINGKKAGGSYPTEVWIQIVEKILSQPK